MLLRILAFRYRLLPLFLIPLLAFWKIDWLLDLTGQDSASFRQAETQEYKGREVFASEVHQDTVFLLNNHKYKWTTIHANVLEEDNARYMEVLAFLEDLKYEGPKSIHHQIIVPANIGDLIERVTCAFDDVNEPTTATLRYDMPHAWYAVLIRCQVPQDAVLPSNIIVETRVRRSPTRIKHNIEVESYRIGEANETANLAFCLSPMFGHLDLFRILEWRLHHARVGVNTVHWYTRKKNTALETMVAILNHDEGLTDSWKEASPISPDTFETERLQEHGLYGDQVLYYIDCLERSKHLSPTNWLAFIDLDEFFLPDPFDLSGVDDFLDLSNHSDVATICLDRSQADTSPERGEHSELLFEHLSAVVERKKDHPTDNRKCLHRPGSLLVPFVHWPLLLREGRPGRELIYNAEGNYLRLLHASRKQYWGDKVDIVKTDQYSQHVRSLRRRIDYYLRTYSELFQ